MQPTEDPPSARWYIIMWFPQWTFLDLLLVVFTSETITLCYRTFSYAMVHIMSQDIEVVLTYSLRFYSQLVLGLHYLS